MRSGAAVRLADCASVRAGTTEAGALLAGNEVDGRRSLPLARLHLVRGEADVAAAVLRRSLGSRAGRRCCTHPALALWPKCAGRRPPSGRAPEVHERLRSSPPGSGLPHVRALADAVDGLLARSGGAARICEAALGSLRCRRACRTRPRAAGWRSPACSATTCPRSRWPKARAALDVFRALGAAARRRRGGQTCCSASGSGPRARPPGRPGALTAREREVLRPARRGAVEPADRRPAVPQQAHGGAPRRAHLHQARVATRAEAMAYAVRHGVD